MNWGRLDCISWCRHKSDQRDLQDLPQSLVFGLQRLVRAVYIFTSGLRTLECPQLKSKARPHQPHRCQKGTTGSIARVTETVTQGRVGGDAKILLDLMRGWPFR
eukprot:Rmarinus@m.9468